MNLAQMPLAAPVITSFTINSGAASTASLDVTLSITLDCGAYVRFKNRYADPWGAWQPLSTYYGGQVAWRLADGAGGARAVYAQVKDNNGVESAFRADTIQFAPAP